MNRRALFGRANLLAAAWIVFCLAASAQDEKKAAAAAPRAAIQITFLPPPLEGATYSLGIYEAKSGKLIRHLHEISAEAAFTVGLNGLITKWDGADEAGQPVPAGRYAARGYAVGALKIEGEDILGNDWIGADENLRIKSIDSIELVEPDNGFQSWVLLADGERQLIRFSADGKLVSRRSRRSGDQTDEVFDHLLKTNHKTLSSPGKDGTSWSVAGPAGVVQSAPDGTAVRHLEVRPGDPLPIAISASTSEDRLYLLEKKDGWQRVRGLAWVESKEEDGKKVSTWQTFFERSIRAPNPALGLEGPVASIEISLVENPLVPGKPQTVKLSARSDDKGSYLATADRLRLRQISERANLQSARLMKGKSPGSLTFFQYDGAAWDEFSIEGAKNMMAFDAGEFEMTGMGEKPVPDKAPEPAPDL